MTQNADPIRLFVLSLCRDCAATLPPFLKMLDALDADPRFQVHAIFGENGSRDGTRTLLEQAAINPRRRWLDTAFMAKVPERLARMAQGREALRRALPPAQPGDVVMVADPDLHVSPTLDAGLLSAALDELTQEGVTGLCSHSHPRYYDILALEIAYGDPNPALARHLPQLVSCSQVQKLLGFRAKIVQHSRVLRLQNALGTGAGLRAISAFNGLCVYRRDLYDRVSYIGDAVHCEHVHLHRALHALTGGRILVSRVLGVIAPDEHLQSLGGVIFSKIARALRSRADGRMTRSP